MSQDETLGDRIKAERIARGWSQNDLAVRAGLPAKSGQQAVQGLEVRRATRSSFAPAFCKALDLNLYWAMTGEGTKYAKDAPRGAKGKEFEEVTAPIYSIPELGNWLANVTRTAAPHVKNVRHVKMIFGEHGPMLIDTTVKAIDRDAVYSFTLNGQSWVKKVERRPDASLWVILPGQSNPTYKVTAKDKLRVDGRVLVCLQAVPPA